MTAVLLGAYGLALSLVVPGLLARARWPDRAPAAAVALWQSVAVAAGLCAVGVVLAGPEEFVRARGSGPVAAVWVLLAALAVAAVIVLRLVVALVSVLRRSRTRRERQRLLVDLLDRAGTDPARLAAEAAAGRTPLRVLDGPVPLAYCLPGRSPRVVLSAAALARLGPGQVAAVVAHERAHLAARHDLVLEFFTAVHRAVPPPLRNPAALEAVPVLLEMLADDAARSRCGAEALRSALAELGGISTAVAAPGPPGASSDGAAVEDRVRRLARLQGGVPVRSRGISVAGYSAAGAVLLVPTIGVVVPWLLAALPWLPLTPRG